MKIIVLVLLLLVGCGGGDAIDFPDHDVNNVPKPDCAASACL